MFDIKNQNTFLGGQNVHNLIIIGLLIFIIYKIIKKDTESGYAKPKDDASKALKAANKAYQDYKKSVKK